MLYATDFSRWWNWSRTIKSFEVTCEHHRCFLCQIFECKQAICHKQLSWLRFVFATSKKRMKKARDKAVRALREILHINKVKKKCKLADVMQSELIGWLIWVGMELEILGNRLKLCKIIPPAINSLLRSSSTIVRLTAGNYWVIGTLNFLRVSPRNWLLGRETFSRQDR